MSSFGEVVYNVHNTVISSQRCCHSSNDIYPHALTAVSCTWWCFEHMQYFSSELIDSFTHPVAFGIVLQFIPHPSPAEALSDSHVWLCCSDMASQCGVVNFSVDYNSYGYGNVEPMWLVFGSFWVLSLVVEVEQAIVYSEMVAVSPHISLHSCRGCLWQVFLAILGY